jgi:hypothetical protein
MEEAHHRLVHAKMAIPLPPSIGAGRRAFSSLIEAEKIIADAISDAKALLPASPTGGDKP